MKSSEFIQAVAGLMQGGQELKLGAGKSTPELEPVDVKNADGTEADIMVPPLQAKLELLKKAVDVDSFYDGGEECATQDPLSVIMKNAGLGQNAACKMESDED